jgi:hypothetical protein
MLVCGLFTVFWLSFGFILLPTLELANAYSTTGSAAEGAASAAYNAAIALYLIVWGFALLTFFVFTLKTNMIFAGIFFFVTLGSFILSGAYWRVSTGDYSQAMALQKVSWWLQSQYHLTKCFSGWRRNVVHRWTAWLVHYGRHHSGGDENGCQFAGGRSEPLLAIEQR